jgi:amino acid transporter
VLGLPDLSLFLIAALVNLNSVPVVASVGASAMVFWLLGFVLFFLPESIAVLELTKRYPHEGGIYLWVKTAFGDFNGFIAGWFYWINNIFYIPTLLFYIVGFAVFIGGEQSTVLGQQPLFMISVSLAVLWAITFLNIVGLGVGKWIQNLGASGTFLTTGIIVGIGIVALRRTSMATEISLSTILPAAQDWRALSLLSVVCLNFVGVELGSIMGDEIKDPRRNIPRAVLVAGFSTVMLYVLTTFALQATLPAAQIGLIDGILQAAQHTAQQLDMNVAGNTSAWLSGSARIPFVIGIDRYLPPAFGTMHPRFQTPHVALIVQGIASSAVIVVSGIGSTVHDIYLILLQTTVILQLIPFLYMFATLIWVRRKPGGTCGGGGFFKSTVLCYAAGLVGFLMTALATVLALVPSNVVTDAWNFELKTVLGVVAFTIPGFLIYRAYHRKLRFEESAPQAVVTD